MTDLVVQLREYASHAADGSAIMCTAPMQLLEQAASEIEFMRSTARAVSQGRTLSDIKNGKPDPFGPAHLKDYPL